MKRQLFLIGIPLFLLGIYSCDEKESDHNTCENQVIIGNDDYNNTSGDHIPISTLELNENCLKISVSGSGCDGSTWIVELIASEDILYSDPPQRNVKISFQNNELCAAVIGREFTFDITSLGVSGSDKVLLNIVNAGEQILYEY